MECHPSCIVSIALVFALGAAADAGDFVGVDRFTSDIYDLDTASSNTTPLGTVSPTPTFGFVAIDRAPDGTLYAVSPEVGLGYSVYSIDEVARTATLLQSTISTVSGVVGIAADPAGGAVWVGGFIGISLSVRLERLDLATGVVTQHGTFIDLHGLGFDDAGVLYSTTPSANGPVLVRIDVTNAANSTLVGTGMPNVDMSLDVDLASSIHGSGLTIFSPATDTLFAIDTATGVASVLADFASGPVTTFAANACAGDVTSYGAGCAGTGGFVPALRVRGCPEVGNTITIDLSHGLGGSSALLLVGLGQSSIPVGGGCVLLVAPLSPISVTLPLGGAGAGAGSIAVPLVVTPISAGASVTLQAFVFDPSSGIGAAGSNAVAIMVP